MYYHFKFYFEIATEIIEMAIFLLEIVTKSFEQGEKHSKPASKPKISKIFATKTEYSFEINQFRTSLPFT